MYYILTVVNIVSISQWVLLSCCTTPYKYYTYFAIKLVLLDMLRSSYHELRGLHIMYDAL